MKRLLFILLTILLSQQIYAQELSVTPITRYKIIKKNGIVFVGEIVEKIDGQPYKIKLDNNSIIEIRESEILRMKPIDATGNTLSGLVKFEPAQYKWTINTELLGLANNAHNVGGGVLSGGVAVSAHRQWNALSSAGIGLGMYNFDANARRLIIPLYLDAKHRFVKSNSTPILTLKAGYGFTANNFIPGLAEKKGGTFINPFFGYEFGVSRKISWAMGLGVILQNAYYAYREGTTFTDEDIKFRRTEFKVLISIH